MKVTVINASGNVGKTTISRYLLAPRMNNAQIITVDSTNLDGTEEEVLRGEHFGELQRAAALLDDVVVDVGSSHSEEYLSLMQQYGDSHYDYDYFVIPTAGGNADPKKNRDTIKTLAMLSAVGVPPEKLRVVLNIVRAVDNPAKVFSGLFDYYDSARTFTLNPAATVHVNDIYARLNGTTKTIEQIIADENDYKEMMRAAADMDERLRCHDALALKRLAGVVTKELDTVFVELFK